MGTTLEDSTEESTEESTDTGTDMDVTTDMATTDMVTAYMGTVVVVAQISLDQTYTAELADPTSSEYMALEADFTAGMDEIMTAQFGSDYNRTEVLGFSAGSVVVDFQTIFNQAPVASDNFLEATTTAMENAIVAAISGGSLGNLTVVAGSFGVATDIEVSSFSFVEAADDLDFDFNVDNIYEMTVTLSNSGGADVDSIANDGDSTNNNADNFAIYFVVSDTSNLDDSSALTIWTDADTSDATNMQAGINSGSTLVIADVFAMINVPKADCGLYTHLCVYVNGTSDAVFSDSDSSNDYTCIEAFGTDDADYLPCSGCIARVSLLVIVLAMVAQLLSLQEQVALVQNLITTDEDIAS